MDDVQRAHGRISYRGKSGLVAFYTLAAGIRAICVTPRLSVRQPVTRCTSVVALVEFEHMPDVHDLATR